MTTKTITSMRAFQLTSPGKMAEVVAVPMPEPGFGQVRLRVAGSGLCHSDLHIIHAEPSWFKLPMTIGHEPTGWVDALGEGVNNVAVGDPYGVYFPWGCGHCARCAVGEENICEKQVVGPGGGRDGGMADYILVDDVRHLVPLGGLDPIVAAPLLCAGLTTYHAIKSALPRLVPGSFAVVIGVGGLGHLAIQMLRALSPARIIAVDSRESKLVHALELGANDSVLADADAARKVRKITNKCGAALMLDMVGTDATLEFSKAALGRRGELMLIGAAGGTLPLRFLEMPRGASITIPYAGTLSDLYEVIALAQAGLIAPEVERIGFSGLPDAYARMAEGSLRGRAVLVPSL